MKLSFDRNVRRVLLLAGGGVVLGLVAWFFLRPPSFDREKIYRIGFGIDTPMHFPGADGQPNGLAVELVQEAAKRSGIKLRWVQHTGFNQQQLDMWVLQTIRPERRNQVYITDPYLQTETSFLVLANSGVREVGDLKTSRISSARNAALREALMQILPEVQHLRVETSVAALEKVTDGSADAAFVDQFAVVSSLLEGRAHPPLRMITSHLPKRSMGLAATFANAPVADEIRRSMRTMVGDGSVEQIIKRWTFFPNPTTDVIGDLAMAEHRARWLWAGLVGLSLIVAVMIWLTAWNRRQTARLRRAENLLRNVADRVPGVVYQFRLNADGTSCFPYASEVIRQIYRVSPAAVRTDATAVFAVLHPDDLAAVNESIQQSARELTPWNLEYRVKFGDGTERWLLGNALPQREAGGATLWHGFIMDITERKRAEAALQSLEHKIQETQKLESLGVLAGGIAHDFNNILTGILGNTNLASYDLPASAPGHGYLESIKVGCLRAADLCKQMLAYSGKGRFIVTKFSLNALVEETTQLLQLSISKQVVLRFNLAPQLPLIEADATQIRQVIMNLVINGSEAIGAKGGVVTINTGVTRVDQDYLRNTVLAPDLPVGHYVFLEVCDTGSGMTVDTQAKIFDPFFTTKFAGRGLGLAAVLGILRGHDGALKVYSEVGRGSTFKLLFPAAGGTADLMAVEATLGAGWRGHGRVLIVDDEEAVRTTGAAMVQKLGFDATLAADGREGLEIFRTAPEQFCAVLMDLTMPHMDGKQAFAEFTRVRADVRVVLMSGFNEEESVSQFAGKGLAGFLQKPFQFEELSRALRNATNGGA